MNHIYSCYNIASEEMPSRGQRLKPAVETPYIRTVGVIINLELFWGGRFPCPLTSLSHGIMAFIIKVDLKMEWMALCLS